MKIKLISAFFLFVFTISVYGQKIGVKAGFDLNTSKVEYSVLDSKMRHGFHVGAISQFNIGSKGWNINAGLLYLQNGFKLTNDGSNNTTPSTTYVDLNKMKLPVGIRKDFNTPGVRSFIEGGVYASYILRANSKIKENSEKLEFKKTKERTDLGVSLGIGTYITDNIELMANYEYGFTTSEMNFKEDSKSISLKNRLFSVSAAYKF